MSRRVPLSGMNQSERSLSARRRTRRLGLAKELGSEYLRSSSLHGLRFLSERGLSALEKIFWIGAFLISLALCSLLICRVYEKWNTTPIIVGFSEKLISVNTFPFPSITICPHIKVRAQEYNFTEATKKYENNDKNFDRDKYNDIALVCYDWYDIESSKNGTEIIRHIEEMAPTLIDTVYYPKDYRKVFTRDGLCFNNNGLAADEILRDTVQSEYKYSENDQPSQAWSMETGYTSKDTKVYPFMLQPDNPFTSRYHLKSNASDYNAHCNGLYSGYRIYLHHPADLPQSTNLYYDVSYSQLSSLAVSVHSTSTSKSLSNVSPEIRQCYFHRERYLRYFKIYTAQNCRLECLSNYTFATCKCVAYYMPHSNSSEICAGSVCPIDTEYWMTVREEQVKRVDVDTRKVGPPFLEPCRCLPLCDSVEYEADVYNSDYNMEKQLKHNNITSSIKYSLVNIYYKKPHFMGIHRSELFGLTDFLANIGGLLGLFLGFSVLSLVEIMYYCTLRLGFVFKRDLEKEKQNSLVENLAKTVSIFTSKVEGI